jgi:thiamine-phosphate pyrophosphorylase
MTKDPQSPPAAAAQTTADTSQPADPTDRPQLYIVTPTAFDPTDFTPRLAAVLDATDIACVRLALASENEDDLTRAADALRTVCHARDVPLVLAGPPALALRLGLDGVHLADGTRGLRAARKDLGADAILGAYCGQSRHDGMTAGDIGADYVSFGPLAPHPILGETPASRDLFAWWSEMIEVPVVAEGAVSRDLVAEFAPVTDFFAIGAEIWRAEDPAAALLALTEPLRA